MKALAHDYSVEEEEAQMLGKNPFWWPLVVLLCLHHQVDGLTEEDNHDIGKGSLHICDNLGPSAYTTKKTSSPERQIFATHSTIPAESLQHSCRNGGLFCVM